METSDNLEIKDDSFVFTFEKDKEEIIVVVLFDDIINELINKKDVTIFDFTNQRYSELVMDCGTKIENYYNSVYSALWYIQDVIYEYTQNYNKLFNL